MTKYKHTQIGYLMLVVTMAVLVLFACLQITARAETPSVDSGTNFAVSAIMVFILLILASFSTLTILIDDKCIHIKFGYGVFRKKIALNEIVSVTQVKNHWYHSWGIHLWFRPYMWVYNVSGFDAVELHLKNGKIYRIGTDEPVELISNIKQTISILV